MDDELPVLLTYVRFVLYPLLSLSLIILAFCGKSGKHADAFWLHITLATFFIAAGAVAVISVTGTPDQYTVLRNLILSPALFILVVVSWYTALRYARTWVKAANAPHKRRSTNGTSDSGRLVQVRREC